MVTTIVCSLFCLEVLRHKLECYLKPSITNGPIKYSDNTSSPSEQRFLSSVRDGVYFKKCEVPFPH